MEGEYSSLTNPSISKSPTDRRYYLFVCLNVAVVVFVFLAFVFAILAFSNEHHYASIINNSTSFQQTGQLELSHVVDKDFHVAQGSIVSFCSGQNTVCEGLGPAWFTPYTESGSPSGAILGNLVQLRPNVAIYPHVAATDPTTLRFSIINTSITTVSITKTLPLSVSPQEAFVDLRTVATSDPNTFVVLYTIYNQNATTNTTFVLAGTIQADLTDVTLGQDSFLVLETASNGTQGPLRMSLIQAGAWTLVAYGFDNQEISFNAYIIDTSADGLDTVLTNQKFGIMPAYRLISGVYLGNDVLLLANGNNYLFAVINFASKTITKTLSGDFGVHHFEKLWLTPIDNGWVVFSGIQTLFVDAPVTIAFVVGPDGKPQGDYTYLFTTDSVVPAWNHLSSVYIPPHSTEPLGGLMYSYVDSRSRLAKVVRARLVMVGNGYQVVTTPAFDVSTYEYGRFMPPLLAGPTANNLSVIVIQDQYAVVNSFYWTGGFQYAGIAQASGSAGAKVSVARQGVSSGHSGLLPGHRYYVSNDGTLLPYMMPLEQFSFNGLHFPIGVAISDHQLLIADSSFESFGWGGN